jgi:CelD/BcsL family acetyltransferase involved in cellulose biosynthesis
MDFSLYDHFPPELAAEWDALVERSHANGPFLRFGYQKIWWEYRGGGEWPVAELLIVTARQEGRLLGIAPLFFTPDYQGKARLMIVGSVEVSDYLDMIAEPQDVPAFAAGLLAFLQSAALPTWQGLDLFNILDGSPTLTALRDAAAANGWQAEETRAYHCPHILMPGDWETYLAGIDKKQRHEIRRKMRRLDDAPVPSRWYTVEDAQTLDAEFDGFVALMEQDEDKLRFLTPPMRQFMRANFKWAFEAGFLFMAFLEIDGQKAAGYLSYKYLNRLWVYNSGINRTFMEYSPGWVLLGDLLKWCNDNKLEAFDFMRGDEEYKYRFGATDRFVMRLVIDK